MRSVGTNLRHVLYALAVGVAFGATWWWLRGDERAGHPVEPLVGAVALAALAIAVVAFAIDSYERPRVLVLPERDAGPETRSSV